MLKIGHEVTRPGKKIGAPPLVIQVPQELETMPGIPTNQREVEWYAREYPLETLNITERSSREWFDGFRNANPEMRAIRKEHDRLNKPLILNTRITVDMDPTAEPTGEDISQLIKERALELGFVEVGFTAYDHRYDYHSRKDDGKYPHAICLANEQEYEPSQTIPSIPAEIVHSSTYRTQAAAALELGNYVRCLGYHAQVIHSSDATGPLIPMFVAAGLGQLGACGYMLSARAGNRMRLMVISTDAKVTYDEPVDYGIHAFCQVCQVCVNRCPGRALMRDKVWWRGIEKNKLYYKRCRPVMARYMSCGVCMKACPVQKYGMATVMAHYAETGQVLGKGTHDLEGFILPGKGYFGPGEMPVFEPSFFDMPHGSTDDWALHRLKEKFVENDSRISDEMLEEFKKEVITALTQGADSLSVMKLLDEQDYV